MKRHKTYAIRSSRNISSLSALISHGEVVIACEQASETYKSEMWIDSLKNINSEMACSKAQLERSLEMDEKTISQPITL